MPGCNCYALPPDLMEDIQLCELMGSSAVYPCCSICAAWILGRKIGVTGVGLIELIMALGMILSCFDIRAHE